MKVILTKDVDSLGHSGQVVDVKDGFARNFLFPKKMAQKATGNIVKHFEEREKAIANRMAQEIARAQEEGKKLQTKPLEFTAKVGEEGRLYGTITTKEIAQALQEQLGHEVDRKKIHVPSPIKHVGKHTVEVKLHTRVTTPIQLIVTAEGGDEFVEEEEDVVVVAEVEDTAAQEVEDN
jgi:large subunit ribosomal protein L9